MTTTDDSLTEGLEKLARRADSMTAMLERLRSQALAAAHEAFLRSLEQAIADEPLLRGAFDAEIADRRQRILAAL